MRWLLHGNIAQAAVDALVRHGDQAQRPPEAGIPEGATHEEILKLATSKQLDLLTNDGALANAPYELGFAFNRCIVYLQLAGGEVEQDDAIDRLYARYKRLTPGRLYTVTESRVKIRQLPRKHQREGN